MNGEWFKHCRTHPNQTEWEFEYACCISIIRFLCDRSMILINNTQSHTHSVCGSENAHQITPSNSRKHSERFAIQCYQLAYQFSFVSGRWDLQMSCLSLHKNKYIKSRCCCWRTVDSFNTIAFKFVFRKKKQQQHQNCTSRWPIRSIYLRCLQAAIPSVFITFEWLSLW